MPKRAIVQFREREESFDFLDARFFFELPSPMGEEKLRADLLGSFRLFTDRRGNIEITHLYGLMSSLRLPISVRRRTVVMDTGPIVIRRAAIRAPEAFVGAWGAPNTGHIDARTGAVKLTWGAEAVFPHLRRLGIGAIPVLLHEVGILDPHSGRMHTAGTGFALSPAFRDIACLCCNCSKTTPTATLSTISLSYPLAGPPTVCTPVTITATVSPAPPAGTTVTFSWTGLALGKGPTPTATFSPPTAPVGPGGTATTTFHITSGVTGQRGDIDATGSDGSAGVRTIYVL